MSVTDSLVTELLNQVQVRPPGLTSPTTEETSSQSPDARIETVFLQLVLTRLWAAEIRQGSHVLRQKTLQKLGGAEEIVRAHLDDVMGSLTPADREICSRFFDRLVTPSGAKIACRLDDLIKWAGDLPLEVNRVVKFLTENRILRQIPLLPGQPSQYEIFHDVLASSILRWEREYDLRQANDRTQLVRQKAEREQKRASWFGGLLSITLLLIIAAGPLVVLKAVLFEGASGLVLGMTFVFVLISAICSALAEAIAQALHWRASTLEMGIRGLIIDPILRDAFYHHPLIKTLSGEKRSGGQLHPSYIPPPLFALVLLDVALPEGAQKPSAQDQVVGDLEWALRALAATTDTELEASRKSVEVWFDEVMDRVSGWYKRKIKWLVLLFALVVTGLVNADSINVAKSLWQSQALRASMVEAANSHAATAEATGGQGETPDQLQHHLDQFSSQGILRGWAGDRVLSSRDPWQWLTKIVGLMLTALLASLLAPFWFDLVKRITDFRPRFGRSP